METLKETLVIDRHEFSDEPKGKVIENNEERSKNYTKILSDIEEILGDDERIKEIMGKSEKGKTEEEYADNRAKRIDLMLKMAGDISYEDT